MTSALAMSDSLVNYKFWSLSAWSCPSSYLPRMVSVLRYILSVRWHWQPVFFDGIILSLWVLFSWVFLPLVYSLKHQYMHHSHQTDELDHSTWLTINSIDLSDSSAMSQERNAVLFSHSHVNPAFSQSYEILLHCNARVLALCAFHLWRW
jgi:hypothetical protein